VNQRKLNDKVIDVNNVRSIRLPGGLGVYRQILETPLAVQRAVNTDKVIVTNTR